MHVNKMFDTFHFIICIVFIAMYLHRYYVGTYIFMYLIYECIQLAKLAIQLYVIKDAFQDLHTLFEMNYM